MKEVKNRIAKALEVRDMTAAELSKKSGIGKSSISKYLKGTVIPKQTAIYQMAQALDVDPGWLLGLDVTMNGRHLAIDFDRVPFWIEVGDGFLTLSNSLLTLNT